MRTLKVGLALGSGAFRGLAHIGLLDVFEKEGIPIDLIAGTSIGSLVGAVYAAGRSPAEMEAYACDLKEIQYYDIGIPRRGFLAGKRLQSLIEEITGRKTFQDTRIPFAAVACDFETMEQVVLRDGFLHEAVRASVSIPAVFVPVEMDGRVLVDGGLLNRVPADVCRSMGADVVIGVDVGYRGQRMKTNNILEHVVHMIDIYEWQVAQQRVSEADIIITPNVLDIDPVRLGSRAAECVERGRTAAREALPKVLELIWEASKKSSGQ